jgi:hypothetical protein
MTYPNDPSTVNKLSPTLITKLKARLKTKTSTMMPEMTAPQPEETIFTKEGVQADAVRDRLAAIAMEWFHQCQQDRNRQERQWYLNLAFFYGNQHVQFRQVSANGPFDLWTPKANKWTVRLVVNQVRKIIRKNISRLTAQKPNAFIIPASSEDADVFAAQAGEQIWDSLWRRLNFNKVLREAVFWQSVCGNGYIKTWWDKEKVDPDNPETPGDICIQSISPFYVFVPDLMATDIEDQPYVIHAQRKAMSWVKQVFNIDSQNTNLDSVDDQLRSAQQVDRNNNKKEETLVLELWVKPGYLPELPNGGMFTVANEKVVQGFDKWPFETLRYPFAKLDDSPTGKFYTSSIIEDLIPLQRELNRSRSQLIESKNRMSKPQLVAEKGAVDAKRITTEPGQLIEYNLGHQPPQPLPLQNLPSYVTEEINRLYDDMADLSGQHEVSNGSTPPGVTAATAISFLQEQDESLIASSYSSIEEAVEKIASLDLLFVKTYWDEARTVKVVGLEGTFDVQTFKNSDLRGNTDLRVESGSALPQSRAAKQAFIMDLMKMGFIPPDEGLEILEVGGLQSVYERVQVDKRQAQRENLKLRVITEQDQQANIEQWQQTNPELTKDSNSGLNLEPPLLVPVHTYDNHEVHIVIHNNYRKSQNFEATSPFTKALFEEHVKQHQEALTAMYVHPLTGMAPSDPNAMDPQVEQDQAAQMQQGDPAQSGQVPSGSPGPVPMPDIQSDPNAQQ